jgi:hypothetical protein
MSDSSDFVGRGISFPFRVDQSGSIATSTGTDGIDSSLRMVLMTAPGERVMRPKFGCKIWDLLFEPINANTGQVLIHIDYVVRSTNDKRNLVYPFYVIPQEGEG